MNILKQIVLVVIVAGLAGVGTYEVMQPKIDMLETEVIELGAIDKTVINPDLEEGLDYGRDYIDLRCKSKAEGTACWDIHTGIIYPINGN